MTNLQALQAQRAELDAQINARKAEAVQQVRDFMTVVGVTIDDLTGKAPREHSVRPVKYRGATGETWTGIGQRPRWLRARLMAGDTLEMFQVPK